jgi:hypothetical protein
MKEYNSMYLGICINNQDPERRGRVQVFVPHIMPAIYQWNRDGEDIEINCVGNNIEGALTPEIVEKLIRILPWAEAASPILGTSAPGNLTSGRSLGQALGGAAGAMFGGLFGGAGGAAAGQQAGAAVGGAVGGYFDQSPSTTVPTEVPPPLQGGPLKFSGYKAGGKNGNWAGSPEKLSSVLPRTFKASSQKREVLNGNKNSDHNYFNEFSYAVDLGLNTSFGGISKSAAAEHGSEPNQTAIQIANNMRAQVGKPPITSWKQVSSPYSETTSDGYRIQLIWQSKAHYDHIHLGVKYTGKGEPTISASAAPNPVLPQAQAQGFVGQPTAGSSTSTGTPAPQTGDTPASPTAQVLQDANKGLGGGFAQSPPPPAKPAATPGMMAGLAAIAQGESGFSVKEANKNTYNYPHGDPKFAPGSKNAKVSANANVRKSMENASGYKPANGDLATAMKLYGDYGFFQNNDANEGQKVFNYLTKQGNSQAQFYRDAITNGQGTGSFSVQDQSQAMVYLFSAEPKLASTKAGLDQLDINDSGFQQKAGSLIMQHKNKWFGIDEGVAAGATSPTSSAFQKIAGESLVNAENTATSDPASDLVNAASAPPNMMDNTYKHGPVTSKNTNDAPAGMFAYPGPGAMIWVFFREGNPIYPVYFAASYGQSEWSAAYTQGSKTSKMAFNGEGSGGGLSHGTIMNPLKGGASMEFGIDYDGQDPGKDNSHFGIFNQNKSNLLMDNKLFQTYANSDRLTYTTDDDYETVMGAKERWYQGNSNKVVMGNEVVKIGDFSKTAMDAMKELEDFSYELNQTLLQNK